MAGPNAAVKAKIAALRRKTTRAGCTEAEALAAAETAARLMREHGLDEADLDVDEQRSAEPTIRPTWRDTIVAAIQRCTNTGSIFRPGEFVAFVGRAPGPEIAVYLREVVNWAVVAEIAAFKKGTFYRRRRSLATKRQAVADFTDGLVQRLAHRLLAMFRATMNADLRLEADKALDERYPSQVSRSIASRDTRYDEAVSAGRRAAGAVPLNHGVAGGRAPTQPVKAPAPRLAPPPAQGRLF